MATPPPVFKFLFDGVLDTLHQWIITTSESMAVVVGTGGSILFAIYVMLWGIAVLRGVVQEPLSDGFMRIIRGVVILMFATSAGIYSEYVVEFFWTVPGAIAAEVVQTGSSSDFSMSDNDATAKMLDSALGKGLDAGYKAWNMDTGLSVGIGLGLSLIALIIWLFVALVCAYAAALVLVANIGLSLMLGIGPLFILCAMFESTQQLFVAWTRQLITFAVFFIVLAGAISITFSFFNSYIGAFASSSISVDDVSLIIVEFVKLICACVASLIVLYQSTSWASGLAGGVSVAASGAVGGMVDKVPAAVKKTARLEHDPNKQNKDGTRGGMTWRGAAPIASQEAARRAAYMRRNQVKKA